MGVSPPDARVACGDAAGYLSLEVVDGNVVVAPRGGVVLPELPFDAERVIRIKMPFLEISSTDIRERAKAGRSLRYLVPDAVADYITEHKLYR